MADRFIAVDRMESVISVFGSFDENIKLVENHYKVAVSNRDGELKISGDDEENTDRAAKAIEHLLMLTARGENITSQEVNYVISVVDDGGADKLKNMNGDCVCVTSRGKPIKAKTLGQKNYLDAIKKNTIVLGVGPAGTGKTYLAVAMAVQAFRDKQVNRIILTRPAVEAGEKLGFLPGDLQNKVDPYLRPLYDGLFDMLGVEAYNIYLQRGNIEVAPLAYMRGRTLDDAFIILDEAQNTTREQMKMFLTRLGVGSKAVITGDITQIDLPMGQRSGLVHAMRILEDIDDIEIVKFTEKDVVRHALVQKIIKAYEKADADAKKVPRRPRSDNNETNRVH